MYTIIVTVARLPSHLSRVQLKKVGGGRAPAHSFFTRCPEIETDDGKKKLIIILNKRPTVWSPRRRAHTTCDVYLFYGYTRRNSRCVPGACDARAKKTAVFFRRSNTSRARTTPQSRDPVHQPYPDDL